MTLKELQAKFAKTMADFETLNKQENLSAEDHERLDGMLADAKATKAQIEQAQEAVRLAEWGSKSAGSLPLVGAGAQAGSVNFEGFSPAGDDEGIVTPEQFKAIRTPEYGKAWRQYLRAGIGGMKSADIKTLQEGQDTEGGFLVPADILERVIAKEPAPTTVQSRVTQLNTSSDRLVIPKVNYTTDDTYTTGMRVTWTEEIPASATTARVTDPIFGQVSIPVHTAMMSIPLTNNMIEDAAFPVVSWVSGKFGETIELLKDNMILNGSGIGQPSGILINPGTTNQPATVVSGSASALTADGLIALTMALPPQYDNGAVAVFNKNSAAKAIAQLKDGNNRYLWGSGLQDSGLAPGWQQRRLLGYECIINQFMPDVASNSYSVIFGDLSGYYLANRLGFSVQVLRELYAETNQVLILGRVRFGGQVAEDWKIKIQKTST